jgi:hypothetical protein
MVTAPSSRKVAFDNGMWWVALPKPEARFSSLPQGHTGGSRTVNLARPPRGSILHCNNDSAKTHPKGRAKCRDLSRLSGFKARENSPEHDILERPQLFGDGNLCPPVAVLDFAGARSCGCRQRCAGLRAACGEIAPPQAGAPLTWAALNLWFHGLRRTRGLGDPTGARLSRPRTGNS